MKQNPEFEVGQVIVHTGNGLRGKITAVKYFSSEYKYHYEITFFGVGKNGNEMKCGEYGLMLAPAMVTPHKCEEVFLPGENVMRKETGDPFTYTCKFYPGVIREISFNEKSGYWEHLVEFSDGIRSQVLFSEIMPEISAWVYGGENGNN